MKPSATAKLSSPGALLIAILAALLAACGGSPVNHDIDWYDASICGAWGYIQ